MGIKGTAVAKEAAAMIVRDDDFGTIVRAVEQGRVIYANIRRFIHYLFSCNLSEILTVFVAIMVGWPLPLVALQILWLNMITDVFPALALALEPSRAGIMARPPRDPREALVDRRYLGIIVAQGVLLAAVTLGAFAVGLAWYGRGDAVGHAVTIAFMTLALGAPRPARRARRADGAGEAAGRGPPRRRLAPGLPPVGRAPRRLRAAAAAVARQGPRAGQGRRQRGRAPAGGRDLAGRAARGGGGDRPGGGPGRRRVPRHRALGAPLSGRFVDREFQDVYVALVPDRALHDYHLRCDEVLVLYEAPLERLIELYRDGRALPVAGWDCQRRRNDALLVPEDLIAEGRAGTLASLERLAAWWAERGAGEAAPTRS
jgi:hypothetical protein